MARADPNGAGLGHFFFRGDGCGFFNVKLASGRVLVSIK